jgi:hypothetical protein
MFLGESVAQWSSSRTHYSDGMGSLCRRDILTVRPNLYSTGSPLALSNNVPRTDL